MAGKRKIRQYTDIEKEQALALYAVNGNITYVSTQTGVPKATLYGWIQQADKSPVPVREARTKKRAEFAEAAWETVQMGVELIQRQMRTALDKQAEVDRLIDAVEDDPDMDYKTRQGIIRNLGKIVRPDMRELTIAVGTLYDKRALSLGDSTANENIKIVIDYND
jgi:transposase-like protein